MSSVLDASALLAYLHQESGWKTFNVTRVLLSESKTPRSGLRGVDCSQPGRALAHCAFEMRGQLAFGHTFRRVGGQDHRGNLIGYDAGIL